MPESGNEAARLREVHKYYDIQQRDTPRASGNNSRKPPTANIASSQQAPPDTALAAFLQLVTYRFDAQRAVITLVDKDEQYFIAESTKHGDLVDPAKYQADGDDTWLGSASSKEGCETLCMCTINVKDSPDRHPSFVVKDLQADSRFNRLPYVRGPPHFRFYAGAPLISKEGFRIGTLFVIDVQPRDSVDETELDFLGAMAQNAMKYLELQGESQEQKRHMTMSKGLAALVEGKSRIPSEWLDHETNATGTSKSHAEDIDSAASESASDPVTSKTQQGSSSNIQESELYKDVYARSVNLLRESLDVDYAVFTDTGKENRIGVAPGNVNVVGYSTEDKSSFTDQNFECKMEQGFLKTLCEKYPLGKIWSYHEDGSCEFDDEEPMSLDSKDGSPRSAESALSERAEEESQVLRKCFPNARQVLYSPLYDGDSRNPDYFSACFAVSNHEIPVFTTNIEVAFVRAFVNSVGVICGHLSATLGERQKSEFISSMSHELRSPLHGILASTELLYGTQLDFNQKDLCETVDVCGQTLLDTLSQILDYSKVNNFLRSKHKADVRAQGVSGTKTALHAGSSLHVYSECDVATLCEEAIDVVNMSFTQLMTTHTISLAPAKVFDTEVVGSNDTSREPVVVDFSAPNFDWVFLCSPGAIRRIVMNLVGNSFKYTPSGSISISMDLRDGNLSAEHEEVKDDKEYTVVIKIVDTGKGMSEEFMKNRLFVPFSQESATAPGSGLGLSLVQGIVKSLDGKIEIWSTAGKGTTVEVNLPVKRAPVHVMKPHSFEMLKLPSMSNSMSSEGQTYSIVGAGNSFYEKLEQSLRHYMKTWLSMREVDSLKTPVFTFLYEADLEHFLAKYKVSDQTRYGLVLSQSPEVPNVRTMRIDNLYLEPLRLPFGPRKLLKALQACVNQSPNRAMETSTMNDRPSAAVPSPPKIILPRDDGEASTKTLDLPIRPSIASRQIKHQSELPVSTINPLAERPTPAPRSTSQPETSQTATGSRILCVDDNSINLKLLQTFSRKLGFNVIETAEDGLQALMAAERCAQENNGTGGFDVIFMDLTMPVMDGFESTRKIRTLEEERRKEAAENQGGAEPRRAIIVALTGLASEEDQRRAFAAGVDHFVTKPLRFKDLKIMLSEWKIGGVKEDQKEGKD